MNAKARFLLPRFLPLAATALLACGQKPESIDIQPKTLSLERKGESKSFTATVKDKKGEVIAEVPVEWASSNTKVAKVEGGKVTAVSTGAIAITAKAGEISSQATVEVLVPAKIDIEPPGAVIRGSGLTQELIARTVDDHGAAAPDAKLEWTSSNEAVATVKAGTVTSVGDGETTISVKSGDVSATARILVKGPQPTTIAFDPPTIVLKAGSTQQVNVLISDDTGQPMQKVPVTFAAGDTAIATVSDTGLVTGVKRGNTTVTATAGAATGQVTVSVK